MPFSVEEFHDLVRLLEERPEWRRELRRLVLTDELLALPEQMASLRAVTDQRFQELAQQVAELAEAQRHTERHIAELAEAQKRVEGQFTELAESVRIIANDMGELKGESLENRYRTKGFAYLSRIVRRAYVLSADELTTLVEDAVDSGTLSDDQAKEIYAADVVARGRRREDGAEVYLVVEVSWGVGPDDVMRACRRAEILARTGVTVIPVVAGKWVIPEAGWLARRSQTWQVTDGSAIPPEPTAIASSLV
jgi:hypothetical protein